MEQNVMAIESRSIVKAERASKLAFPIDCVRFPGNVKCLSIIQCYQVKFQWYDQTHRGGEGQWIDMAESLGQVVSVWLESSSAAQRSDRGASS